MTQRFRPQRVGYRLLMRHFERMIRPWVKVAPISFTHSYSQSEENKVMNWWFNSTTPKCEVLGLQEEWDVGKYLTHARLPRSRIFGSTNGDPRSRQEASNVASIIKKKKRWNWKAVSYRFQICPSHWRRDFFFPVKARFYPSNTENSR